MNKKPIDELVGDEVEKAIDNWWNDLPLFYRMKIYYDYTP